MATSGLDIGEIVKKVIAAVSSNATANGNGNDGPPPGTDITVVPTMAETLAVVGNDEPEAAVGGRPQYVKLGTFDGSGSWKTFRTKFEAVADYHSWNNEDKRMHLMTALAGPAAEIIPSCQGTPTYAYLLDRLQRCYGSDHLQDAYKQELKHRWQRSDESLQVLCADVERLAALGYPDITAELREATFTLPAFMEAIADRDIRFEVWKHKPRTLSRAFTIALEVEEWTKLQQARERDNDRDRDESCERRYNGATHDDLRPVASRLINETECTRTTAPTMPYQQLVDKSKPDEQLSEEGQRVMQQLQWYRQQYGPLPPQQVASDASPSTCQTAASSKREQPDSGSTSPACKRRKKGKRLYCFDCKQCGHVRENCHERLAAEPVTDGDEMLYYDDDYIARVNGIQTEDDHKDRAYLRMRINRHWVSCLVDSGCELSILPARLVRPSQIEETRTKI